MYNVSNYNTLHTLIALQQQSHCLLSLRDLKQTRTSHVALVCQVMWSLDVHFMYNLCHGQEILNVTKLSHLFS